MSYSTSTKVDLSRQYERARQVIEDTINEIDQCCVYTGMSTSEVEGNYLTVGFGGIVPARCDYLIVVLTDDNVLMSFDDGVSWLNVFDPAATVGLALVPVGTIIEFAGDENNVPTGYLLCDGSEVVQATYGDLYTLIGTTYGTASSPGTDFVLPDLRGLIPKGVNSSEYDNSNNGSLTTTALADVGGVEDVTLLIGEIPSHIHSHRPGASRQCNSGGAQRRALAATNTANQGSSTSHNNIHPSLVVNYIIKT